MRVIAGICRGKKLFAPSGVTTRPTSDRVKEALFNILSSRVDFQDLRVLDICAGTGSLGIEALSRGAAACCFIESDRSVASILAKNVHCTGFQSRSEILVLDAAEAVRVLAARGQTYDIAFFDPPYASKLYASLPEAFCQSSLFIPGSILVAECSARNALPQSYGRLRSFDRRVYGETALELYILEEE